MALSAGALGSYLQGPGFDLQYGGEGRADKLNSLWAKKKIKRKSRKYMEQNENENIT